MELAWRGESDGGYACVSEHRDEEGYVEDRELGRGRGELERKREK